MSERPKDYALVTTIQTFKTVYMVPVTAIQEDAMENVGHELNQEEIIAWIKDSVTCEEVRDTGTQHLGENIMDAHVISTVRALQIWDDINPGSALLTEQEKIDYINNWKDAYTWKEKANKGKDIEL